MTNACPFRLLPAGRPIADPYEAPLPPPADADEDISLEGLLATAREHVLDLFQMFGAPEDLVRPTPAPVVADDLMRRWVRNLEYIVRQLVVALALRLIASGAVTDEDVTAGAGRRSTVSSTSRRPEPIDWSQPAETWRAGFASVTQASPRPARRRRSSVAQPLDPRPQAASDSAIRPGAALPPAPPHGWARRMEALRRTVADAEAAARRLARRMLRAARLADASNGASPSPMRDIALLLRPPPPFLRPDGSYNPLSRKALIAFWHLAGAVRSCRPDDG
jgi:hypothetical protein